MRRILIAGNWKMNGNLKSVTTLASNLVKHTKNNQLVDIAVFPPAIYLQRINQLLKGSAIKWGAQNLSAQLNGAFTGEISASMLQDLNCHYALIGHSERRTLYHETNQEIVNKFKAAQNNGITPILCVGETLSEREKGITKMIVAEQIKSVLDQVSITEFRDAVIAYEPIWAIGTGETASAAQAQEVHAFIRQQFATLDPTISNSIQIIYGGSVNGSNAQGLFTMPDIDGALVGGASLVIDEFLQIITSTEVNP